MPAAVIIGAGELAGALARQLAVAGLVSSVTLVDDTGAVAQGKALDIQQAGPVDRSRTPVSGATQLDAVVGAAFIVIADHAARGEWRDDAAVGLLPRLSSLNATAPIVCAGADQAPVVERAARELGIRPSRIFGTAPEGLRAAVAAVAALEAGCASTDLSLSVLGRPPHQIIVSWEDASIAGHRATSVLSPPAIARLDARLDKLWPPGPLTLAAAAARAIGAALSRTPRVLSAFVAHASPANVLPRVAMLPVVLGPEGVRHVLAPALSTRDRVRLENAFHP